MDEGEFETVGCLVDNVVQYCTNHIPTFFSSYDFDGCRYPTGEVLCLQEQVDK